MANDYYCDDSDEQQARQNEEQEYQEWLYEIATINEINKELNYESNISSFS